jgi:uncharacterized protein (DUF2249 family)
MICVMPRRPAGCENGSRMTKKPPIDIQSLPPAERATRVLREFDALEPGGCLVLVLDDEPRPLLSAFQAERPAAFDWNVLEGGPERFRVEIVRRRGEAGARAVTECLMTDHQRLDAIVTEVAGHVTAGDYETAGRQFGEFSCGLNRHIEMEESILFPMFERATGITNGGPTEVMRQEHAAIRDFVAAIAAAIRARDAGAFRGAVMGLKETLEPHNIKEEQILYPMTDRAAGDSRARDDLVRRMQAL